MIDLKQNSANRTKMITTPSYYVTVRYTVEEKMQKFGINEN